MLTMSWRGLTMTAVILQRCGIRFRRGAGARIRLAARLSRRTPAPAQPIRWRYGPNSQIITTLRLDLRPPASVRGAEVRRDSMDISVHDVREALTQLGKLLFGEMRVEDALHEIVRTTHAIFDVDGAGLMLADAEHHLRNVAVSDDRLGHLEDLQIRHHEGPCVSAFDDKELVRAEDLTNDRRWPGFTAAAVACGVRAVLASPLPYNQDAVGVVAVLSEDRRPWSPEGELALLAFTDLAALLIASMLQSEEQTGLALQLQGALDSRQVIEQAKGVLMERHNLAPRAAYDRLRAQARAERRKLGLVSAEIVESAARGA